MQSAYTIKDKQNNENNNKNTSSMIPCGRNSCKVEDEFAFDRGAVYEVTVLPVTRSILIKMDPNMQDQLDKINSTETMDSLKCKKEGLLVDMESNATLLCDFVKSPTITLTVNQEPREDNTTFVYKSKNQKQVSKKSHWRIPFAPCSL